MKTFVDCNTVSRPKNPENREARGTSPAPFSFLSEQERWQRYEAEKRLIAQRFPLGSNPLAYEKALRDLAERLGV